MADNLFGATDTGRVRDNNEDAFLAERLPTGWLLACVIDGVGGYEGGEVAAAIAKDTIRQRLLAASGDVLNILRDALVQANENIYAEKQSGRGNAQMACVLTLALVDLTANQFYYAHVGDTRLYLLRDGSLVKVTKDHSFVGFLEDSGRLSEVEAMAHPKRNEINKALGFDAQIDTKNEYIETGSSPFLPGDMLLLCSDGLTDLVDNRNMTAILLSSGTLQQKAQGLIDAANSAGGKDNITVVLVKNDKKPQRQKATKPVLIKKEVPAVDGRPVNPAENVAAPKLVEPVVSNRRKSNTALWVFVGLSLLLALGCFLLWMKNSELRLSIKKSVEQPVRNTDEKRLSDSLSLAHQIFNYSDSGRKKIIVSDTIFINQDSLRIYGNGLVLEADSSFKGPAFFVSSKCKNFRINNLTLRGFKTGIVSQGKVWTFQNVEFENCDVPILQVPMTLIWSDSLRLNLQKHEDSLRWKIHTH